MHATHVFLFGREVANRMQALDTGLQLIEQAHQDYFTTTQSRHAPAGTHQAATLAEFVQPRWYGHQPTLDIDPALPADIAAACLECLHQVAAMPPPPTASRKLVTGLRALFAPVAKAAPPAEPVRES